MCPYSISPTSCACQVLHACPAYSQSAHCNQCERFFNFFFFFYFKRARLFCQCLTQWRVDTYSTQPCQRCLWPSGKIINHPKSPPAFLPSPLSHSTFLHRSRFSSLIRLWQTPSFFLALSSRCLVTHSPSPPRSLSDTRMHAGTHKLTNTVHFHKTPSHIPLPWHDSPYCVSCLCAVVSVHLRVFVYTNVGVRSLSLPIQVAGLDLSAAGFQRKMWNLEENHSGMTFQDQLWKCLCKDLQRQRAVTIEAGKLRKELEVFRLTGKLHDT